MCTLIKKIAIRKALRKPAPSRIPLSGEDAAHNDCYIVTVEAANGEWSGWIQSSDMDGITCVVYDTKNETRSISWKDLNGYKIEIRHYFQYFTFNYETPEDLLQWEWSGYHRWLVLKERIAQYAFNKTQLVRAGRIEVLRHYVTMDIEKGGYKASHIDLVTDLHSMRAFGRSDVDAQMNYYRHICESLVSTSDLAKNGTDYQATARAIVTLSAYEEEDRKHRELWKVQVLLGILTAGSVVVGLLQAYVAYIQ